MCSCIYDYLQITRSLVIHRVKYLRFRGVCDFFCAAIVKRFALVNNSVPLT